MGDLKSKLAQALQKVGLDKGTKHREKEKYAEWEKSWEEERKLQREIYNAKCERILSILEPLLHELERQLDIVVVTDNEVRKKSRFKAYYVIHKKNLYEKNIFKSKLGDRLFTIIVDRPGSRDYSPDYEGFADTPLEIARREYTHGKGQAHDLDISQITEDWLINLLITTYKDHGGK